MSFYIYTNSIRVGNDDVITRRPLFYGGTNFIIFEWHMEVEREITKDPRALGGERFVNDVALVV